MYKIKWSNFAQEDLFAVCTEPTLKAIASMLEQAKRDFTVTLSGVPIEQESLQLSGFNHWRYES